MSLTQRFEIFFNHLALFPWKSTALTLQERFREDRLGLTAGSLTFTTTIALVPFMTVALAVFTAFPMFAKLQDVLQKWLIESLIPENIARQVLGYLTQFAGKASKLGWAGVAVLMTTALTLIFTIDRTLNTIWRVRQSRRFGQRLLIYWTGITLGPLLLGASLTLTSYLVSTSKGLVAGGLPGGVLFILDALEFGLVAGVMAATYYFVPNTRVRWSHAWLGGLFAALGIELAKKLLTYYLSLVPTYAMVYGAFATLPILLVWIYLAWVIVLLGAVITAYLPSLLSGVMRRSSLHGWQFQLAIEVLKQLALARQTQARGLDTAQLADRLQVDVLQLEPVLQSLSALDWVQALDEESRVQQRYVLLADPDTTLLAPLIDRLLLERHPSLENLWKTASLSSLSLRDAL
jgi:membrane protein